MPKVSHFRYLNLVAVTGFRFSVHFHQHRLHLALEHFPTKYHLLLQQLLPVAFPFDDHEDFADDFGI